MLDIVRVRVIMRVKCAGQLLLKVRLRRIRTLELGAHRAHEEVGSVRSAQPQLAVRVGHDRHAELILEPLA